MFSRVSVSASLARPSVAVAAAAGGVAEAATRTLATANINFTEPPAASAKPETKVRVGELENGVRVAAIEGGPSSTVGTVGVFVGSGSRDETTATSGAAHFNKALAYRATEDNTYFLAIRTLEATGAQVSTTSSREATIYTADVLKPHTPTVLSVMADTILNAKVQLYEIEDARAVVGHETHQAMTHGPTFVSERLHATAYGSANLGLPAFCPPEQVNRLARDDLVAFRNGAHVANNIVVAGVGIDFDDLANVAGGVFGGAEGTKQARSKASYTGGSSYTSAPGVTHLAVGFESVASTAGADLFALGVLQNHVSRAVSAAVAGIDGAHGATAGLSAYTDSGLFGVSAAGEAAAMGAVADALVGVLQATKKNLSAADLTQAQNNATADYLMAVEARGTRFEDLGAQVLAGGAFLSPSAVVKGISEVTAASVAKVAKQVLASVPTVVAHGDHSHVPSYANISAQLK